MYQELNAKFDNGTLTLTAELAPDLADQCAHFCKQVAALDGSKSVVYVWLDAEKATARINLTIPASSKPGKPSKGK